MNDVQFYFVEINYSLPGFASTTIKPVRSNQRSFWVSKDAIDYPPHLRCENMVKARVVARKQWALVNPKWLVLLFGDHWQRKYRWLMDES